MRSENRRYALVAYLIGIAFVYVTIDKMIAAGLGFASLSNSIPFPEVPDFVKISRFVSLLISGSGLVVLMKNQQVASFMEDVFSEIKKIAWPLPIKKNTMLPTLVVVIFALICAVILGIFDYFWGTLIRLIF